MAQECRVFCCSLSHPHATTEEGKKRHTYNTGCTGQLAARGFPLPLRQKSLLSFYLDSKQQNTPEKREWSKNHNPKVVLKAKFSRILAPPSKCPTFHFKKGGSRNLPKNTPILPFLLSPAETSHFGLAVLVWGSGAWNPPLPPSAEYKKEEEEWLA